MCFYLWNVIHVEQAAKRGEEEARETDSERFHRHHHHEAFSHRLLAFLLLVFCCWVSILEKLQETSSTTICMWLSSCPFQQNISAWFQLALSTVKIELTSSSCWNLKSCWIESSVLCDIFMIFEGCCIHWKNSKIGWRANFPGFISFRTFC